MKMKIYHTETQEDYDALMVELEAEGIDTLPKEHWKNHRCETVVFVRAIDKNHNSDRIDTTYSDVAWAIYRYPGEPIYRYPGEPITKYKAKVDEKMRFTKENVYKLAERYSVDQGYLIGDLKSDISKLDDTRKKAVVPKCFDEWFKEIKVKYPFDDSAKKFALWKLCQKGFGYGFGRANGGEIHFRSELGTWLNENTFLAIDAVLNGYTIEPEQLYYIPLPHLKTLDGIQQVLSRSKNKNRYFASRPDKNVKQRYTKEELEQVPEIYKPYAKLIEEEEE